MYRGYIKLWRKSVDDPLYFAEPFTKWQAWNDLLLLANHKSSKVNVRGILVDVKSGQVLAGEEFLANRWQWSRGKVRRFMAYLSSKTVQQIVQQKNNVCTLISITNWDHYQSRGTADSTANSTTDGQQTVQQTDTPKNDKNDKNDLFGEPLETDSPEVFLTFPCTGPVKEWDLTVEKLNEWKSTFDTIDVELQCKRALQWVKDNKNRRKTAKGMTRFLGNWLSSQADSNRGNGKSRPTLHKESKWTKK